MSRWAGPNQARRTVAACAGYRVTYHSTRLEPDSERAKSPVRSPSDGPRSIAARVISDDQPGPGPDSGAPPVREERAPRIARLGDTSEQWHRGDWRGCRCNDSEGHPSRNSSFKSESLSCLVSESYCQWQGPCVTAIQVLSSCHCSITAAQIILRSISIRVLLVTAHRPNGPDLKVRVGPGGGRRDGWPGFAGRVQPEAISNQG